MPPFNGRKKAFSDPREKRKVGQVDEGTVAVCWLSTMSVYLKFEERSEETNDYDLLYIATAPKGTIINLGRMTNVELSAYRDFMNLAFDLADKVTTKLDEEALSAYESGNNSHMRIYRQLPVLALRRRVFPEQYEELQMRPFPVANLDGGKLPDLLGLGRGRTGREIVPGVDEDAPVGRNDATETLGAQEMGSVAGERSVSDGLQDGQG
jgi:hypothetical protein